LLPDDTCHFLAADFDKDRWGVDALAYKAAARDMGVAGCRMVSGLSNASGWRMILARGRQEKLVD